MKKLLTLALAALMLAVLLPIPAMAEPITVLDFTQETAPESGNNWTWDKVSKTLTLNGVDLAAKLILPDGATIVVNGTNSISAPSFGENAQTQKYLVSCSQGKVTVTGTGTLNITSGTPQHLNVDNSSDIDLWVGDLVLGMEGQRGPTVTLTNYLKGVAVIKGDIEVNSGNLNIRSTARESGGIAGNAHVKGGSLDIEAMNGGIYGHLTVTGGNVRIKTLNQDIGDGEEGIALEGLLKVEGGVVWLTSHTLIGNYADRFAPAILLEKLREEGLTIKGSTTYADPNPTQTVTWQPYGTPTAPPTDLNPGGPEQPYLYPYIGDTLAKTVRISAGDDSGSQSGIIIYVPTDDAPNTTTSNPTTGAADFVSTATAAALMALLGAAALLRK